MTDHPITPPPELVQQWVTEACPECHLSYDEFTGESVEIIATRAAQYGADQELEECCELLQQKGIPAWSLLRLHRRPKPPSLKEQALMALEDGDTGPGASLTSNEVGIIRRALKSIND
jgi:hypothetical protein